MSSVLISRGLAGLIELKHCVTVCISTVIWERVLVAGKWAGTRSLCRTLIWQILPVGFHASDPVTMRRTVSLAVKHRVRIGAHPGYPDLVGFGRRDMALSADELYSAVLYQLGALDAIARAEGGEVTYVKPHGALYNKMTHDTDTLKTVMSAVARFKPKLSVDADGGSIGSKSQSAGQGFAVTTYF